MNEIKNKYRYVLTDRFGTLDVAPLNEGNYQIDYEIEEDGKYFYSKQFQGKIVFTGDIFARLRRIERSIYICTDQRLQIFRKCGQDELLIFDGFFKLTEGDWDEDNCKVELKFEKNTPDRCIEKNKNKKLNLLSLIYNRKTVNTNPAGGGVFEFEHCTHHISQVDNSTPYGGYTWCGAGDVNDAYAGNWQVYSFEENFSGMQGADPYDPYQQVNNGVYDSHTSWVREIVEVDCNFIAPPNWVLLENNCVTTGKNKFAKPATLYNCKGTQNYIDANNYSYQYDCSILGSTTSNATIDNGMHLVDILNVFLNDLCGSQLVVVSDFFQINPENPSLINYVTGLETQVNNILFFQKSDVKRPSAYNNAWKAEMTFENLMKFLNIAFNVSYAIEDNIFRLEHISWFTKNAGLNLMLPRYERFINGKKKYTYEVDDLPARETWKYKEQIANWEGVIDYNNACSLNPNKKNEENYIIDEMTADVQLCLDNPDSESKVVEDAGFVMIATKKVNDVYYIITEYNAGARLNNTLSFEQLVERYHFHNRPLKNGVFNGDFVEFISTKPFKKGEQITVPLCCGDVFDPNDTITTPLGVGVVKKATFNFLSETIALDLMYNVFENLTNNIAPVFTGNTNLSTYQDEPLIFPLNIQDADGVVVSVGVVYQPAHGTIEVLSTTQAKYTPNAGYIGSDYFHLRAFDDWSEVSNNAGFHISVLPANTAPVATNDTYNVYQGFPFTANPSIFVNDSDDVGFTLVTPNVVTAQGVSVSIDPATGVFSYVPPANFEGVDTFNYTIEDNTGAQSTATVSLVVAYKNKPVAVDDDYLTIKNTVLTTDGTVGKERLFSNDYTPDGLSYSYTTNVENKATTAGGTVQITADGLFTYTPPNNFEGQDTFTYTVNNPNGSSVGTVTINVIPNIYVKLVKTQLTHQNQTLYCGDPPAQTTAGITWRADFVLKFYADAGATMPFDVTGLGFKVIIKQEFITNGGAPVSNIWETSVLSGIETVILENYIYDDETTDCNGQTTGYEVNVTLENGMYSKI